jgi:hypothetical protein
MTDLFTKPIVRNFEEKKKVVLEFLKKNNFATKPQLCECIGLKYNANNDRRIRDVVSSLSQEYPIVSHSHTNKGYRLATSLEDLEEVQHSWKWIDSMIEELEKRKQPLIKFHVQFTPPKTEQQ